jgi:hypothetical protein
MNSGRELDCEVARKLFRFVVMIDPAAGTACTWNVHDRRLVSVPPYSTDVDSAYLVLSHMRSLGWTCTIASNTDSGTAEWTVSCSHPGSRLVAQASTHSMAEAISLAALKVANLSH